MTYTIERITSPERLTELWPQIAIALEPCVRKAMHGEMVLWDIHNLIAGGKAYCFVEMESGVVRVALVLELVPFPRMSVANVFALGGSGLMAARDRFWASIKSWLWLNGVKAVDAWVSDGMKRILERKLGFSEVYHHMRLELNGETL